VSKPVLYQHFPGKLDLYLALLEEHATELVKRVRAALESTTNNKQRVVACMAAYFDFVDGDDEGFRLVFESDLRNDPLVRDRVERMLQECVAAITETIAHDTGFTPDEAQLLSVGLAGMAEIASRWWLAGAGGLPKDRAVELMAGLAWRGISSTPLAPEA
jgi:AcrR family transcriptional regulator